MGRPRKVLPLPMELDSLTPAERRVVDTLLRGLTVPQAAAELGRNYSTMRTQLRSAFKTLGVHSQVEMHAKFGGGARGASQTGERS